MSRAFLHDLLTSIGQKSRELVHGGPVALTDGVEIADLAETILSQRGEASGIALAEMILARFRSMDPTQKLEFFKVLTEHFGAEQGRLQAAATDYLAAPSDQSAIVLHDAAEPRRQELIRRLNLPDGGTGALVAMRSDLLDLMSDHPELAAVDHDFDHLLSSWFNRGFLVLKRIEWDTPASVLEKIIEYEAVHAIQSWDDLRRRIEPLDRRCYAFFHPALRDEPLIFVEVALEREIPGAIAPLLADDRVPTQSDQMTTAVFYSISNCQRGLRGVSFGNFLIKQVVQELARDLPRLKNYVTLSPVVGLLHWVRQLGRDGPLQDNERYQRISKLLEHTGWHQNESIAAELQEMLLPTAAAYFLNAKRGDGMPVDAVARFHLGNGARLERINWLGDLSDVGLNQAGGLMVNYLYKLTDIEKNHEAFVNNRRIAVSNEIRKMAKKWQQEFGFDK
jgi:malonyl-CoA decarboxylase